MFSNTDCCLCHPAPFEIEPIVKTRTTEGRGELCNVVFEFASIDVISIFQESPTDAPGLPLRSR